MTATGTYRFVNVTTGNELIYFRSDSFVGSIDNVKIYYTEEDRSVNNNGLILYGTITKSAVAYAVTVTSTATTSVTVIVSLVGYINLHYCPCCYHHLNEQSINSQQMRCKYSIRH